jgi:HlyD family secretion protein
MASTQSKKSKEIINTLGLDQGAVSQKLRSRWRKWALILLGVLIVLFLVLRRPSEQAVSYKTEAVSRGDLTVIVTATGNLAPTNKVDVGCELSGIVKSVEVDYNARVKVGQPLASLDDTKFEAAVMEAKAALASAQARLKQSKATSQLKEQNLKRLKQAHKLSGGKAPSLGELELAEADVQRAKADVTAAEAAIEQAQAKLKIDQSNLSKTTIYSPINGIVLKRAVDPGQTVAAQLQTPVLFTIAEDLSKMELQVDVDEADVGLVQEGLTATFGVEAYPGRVFTARIAQLRYGSQITNGVVTYTTLLNVENPDLVLRPGMTATAKIVASRIADAVLVPNQALRFTPQLDGAGGKGGLFGVLLSRSKADENQGKTEKRWKIGQTQVWVLKGNQPVAVSVNPGPTDGVHTVVPEGELKPGMEVIVDATYGG